MKRFGGLPMLALIAILPLIASCAEPDRLGQTMSLHGSVYAEPFFGPPNYGENPDTDSREIAYILKLDKPIRVVMSDGNLEDCREVQVINYPHIPKGSDMVVSGQLDEGVSGHHRRKVIVFCASR